VYRERERGKGVRVDRLHVIERKNMSERDKDIRDKETEYKDREI